MFACATKSSRGTFTFGLMLAGLLLVANVGCKDSASSMTVPLMWKPTERLNANALSGVMPETSIYVAAVSDKRTKVDLIGQDIDDDDVPAKPFYPAGDVPEFVQNAIKQQLQNSGLKVVEDQGSADRVITPTLTTFWCEKTGTYKSTVAANFAVADKAGKQLWKTTLPISGEATTWGSSMKAENAQETLSDATLRMAKGLLDNPGFMKAIAKGPSAAGAGASAAPSVYDAEPAAAKIPTTLEEKANTATPPGND